MIQSPSITGVRLICFRSLNIRRPRICTVVSKRSASAVRHSRKSGYPEHLLIYHAGIGRTVFLGCTKITTLFLFAFSSLFIAPTYYYAPSEPDWAAAASESITFQSEPSAATADPRSVIVGGAIPLLFVGYTTKPFVNYVHIRLPLFARQSHEHLLKWSKNIAPETEIDMTTMRLYGLPRVSRMQVADLHERKRSALGVANLARVSVRSDSAEKRPWWAGREVTRFFVGPPQREGREPAIWLSVLEAIRSRKGAA
ncbi:hypothetical protein MMC34_004023 [Xylographa carneopallida]|nr:hypothetical protein [Xylographa carneopallida]